MPYKSCVYNASLIRSNSSAFLSTSRVHPSEEHLRINGLTPAPTSYFTTVGVRPASAMHSFGEAAPMYSFTREEKMKETKS